MGKRNRLPAPRHFQSVVELQYPKAHRYWDDCGKVIATVEKQFPGLICQGLKEGNSGFLFTGLARGITNAAFFWDRASITQVDRGDAGISEAASAFWAIIQDGLGAGIVSRLGHRTWLCYETEDVRSAIKWLEGFSFVAPTSEGSDALGVPSAGGSVFRSKLGERNLRLELNAGSATLKRGEIAGVIADLDIVLEPPDESFNLVEFIEWNITFIRQQVEPLFRSK